MFWICGDDSLHTYLQTVSCENKFAQAHVRARLHMCNVRAKRLSKRACDVCACGRFFGCATCYGNFARFLDKKRPLFRVFLNICWRFLNSNLQSRFHIILVLQYKSFNFFLSFTLGQGACAKFWQNAHAHVRVRILAKCTSTNTQVRVRSHFGKITLLLCSKCCRNYLRADNIQTQKLFSEIR
jgi:hypothetical protein